MLVFYQAHLPNYENADEPHEVCRLGSYLDSAVTVTDQKERDLQPHCTRLCGSCIAAIAGRIWGSQQRGLRQGCTLAQRQKSKSF